MGNSENSTTTLSAYVDESFAEEVRKHAEREGVSISTFITETLERRIEQEAFARVSQETHAERRIEELVAEARDNILEATTDHQGAQREANHYSIALWELLKDEYSDLERQEALKTASRRLQTDPSRQSKASASAGSPTGDETESSQRSSDTESQQDDGWHY